jgi:hypothetical protein
MFYALFKSEKLIGIFNSENAIHNMINGIVQNKFCSKNKLSIRKYSVNTIYEITHEDKNEDVKNVEKEPVQVIELTQQEEEKRNKKKCELEYQLNSLKKEKDKIEESKKTYKVDVELYKKFKKIKEDNFQFDVPELFIEKYKVFEMINKDSNLNWENFYANYQHQNLSSSYGAIFDNDDTKTININ